MAMNPETLKLEEFERKEDIPKGHKGSWTIGELLPWKGVWFRVESITENGIFIVPHEKNRVLKRGMNA